MSPSRAPARSRRRSGDPREPRPQRPHSRRRASHRSRGLSRGRARHAFAHRGNAANEDAARDAIGKLDLGEIGRATPSRSSRNSEVEPRRQGRRGRLLLGRRFRQSLRGRRGGKLAAAVPITARPPTLRRPQRCRCRCCFISLDSTRASDRQRGLSRPPWGRPVRRSRFTNILALTMRSIMTHRRSVTTGGSNSSAWARTLDFFKRHFH